MEVRQETVSLLRGLAAGPLLSCLGEIGLLDQMRKGSFTVESFKNIKNRSAFSAAIRYLISLGLIAHEGENQDRYAATALGDAVFARYGAFCLLDSYQDYFGNFRSLLLTDGVQPRPVVDRALNVLGSGLAHARKFFPPALDFLSRQQITTVIDVGCGDGCFLQAVLDRWPLARAFAVDLSPVAVAAAEQRLRTKFPQASVTSVVADGCEVDEWAAACAPTAETTNTDGGLCIVSAWFVVHEFAAGLPERAISFFQSLKCCLPDAELIVGELVNVPADVLTRAHQETILPEFLLFHALSGQGLLSWEQWQSVLKSIPYQLIAEKQFDVLGDGTEASPSNFIWHLRPLF